MYVTDTNAFVWFLTNDSRLGEEAKRVFLKADKGETRVVVPSIVLLEALHICEKHRAELKFTKVLEKVREAANYQIYPVDFMVVEECCKLGRGLGLHDRVIVAIARLLNAKVLTKDKDIENSGLVEIVW